jgi:multiple sugar transport system ATP-binding protein
MNMIAGLLQPDEGEIRFDGKLMNGVPPGKRNIGFVFQNYAVFSNMTVYDNIAYGLRIKKVEPGEIKSEVEKAAEMLRITPLLKTYASKLSINDMQKTALARTIVTKPSILLLDEPLSNLDTALRNVMRAELKNIQMELGQTSIYVTHDQVEAMSLADRIAVMNVAELQQFDTPYNIYNHPKNLFVANFVGSPTINIFEAEYAEGEFVLQGMGDARVPVSGKTRAAVEGCLQQRQVTIGIRPEQLTLSSSDTGQDNAIKAEVLSREPLGSKTVIYLNTESFGGDPGNMIKAAVPSGCRLAIGEKVYLQSEEEGLYLFDKASQELLLRA